MHVGGSVKYLLMLCDVNPVLKNMGRGHTLSQTLGHAGARNMGVCVEVSKEIIPFFVQMRP